MTRAQVTTFGGDSLRRRQTLFNTHRQQIGKKQGQSFGRSRNTNVLRRAHAKPIGRTLGKVQPGAHAIGNAPRSGIIDAHNNRSAILRICHGQDRADRPRPRCCRIAIHIKPFTTRRALSRRIMAREHFLSGAITRPLYVFVHCGPSSRACRRHCQKAGQESDTYVFHRIVPSNRLATCRR
jgi:hypothetical protein